MTTTSPRSSVIPGLRYRDAPAAIEFLCRVLGFEQQLVVPGADNTIAHAQLKLGGGLLLVGSAGVAPRAQHDEDYGGRGFSCTDPEGRLWYVGTYDPWAEAP
jgi:uncharacterized glyoxalase superfamily protein PhnB